MRCARKRLIYDPGQALQPVGGRNAVSRNGAVCPLVALPLYSSFHRRAPRNAFRRSLRQQSRLFILRIDGSDPAQTAIALW